MIASSKGGFGRVFTYSSSLANTGSRGCFILKIKELSTVKRDHR